MEAGKAPAGKDAEKRKRKPRRLPDVDPIRGRVLYCLAALGYQQRHGALPKPSDLNREIPASAAGAKAYGAWNALMKGRNLPRSAESPQGLLMQKLQELDPDAAECFGWPLWRLSSKAYLSLREVHALMLDLPERVRHQLIGRFTNGRVLRWPTDRLTEVEWMIGENSFDSLCGLIAVMREAELQQQEAIYMVARGGMCLLLPVLGTRLGSTQLHEEFSAFLKERFVNMAHIVQHAYEGSPTSAKRTPPMQLVPEDGDRELAAARIELKWKGIEPDEISETP